MIDNRSPQVIKGIVIGFILAIALSVGCAFIYFSPGLAPVATADPPMPFEKKLANMALDAHIEKQHIPPYFCFGDALLPDQAIRYTAMAG